MGGSKSTQQSQLKTGFFPGAFGPEGAELPGIGQIP